MDNNLVMFILKVLILGLNSKQGDVTFSFLHADLTPDETVYILTCLLGSILRVRMGSDKS